MMAHNAKLTLPIIEEAPRKCQGLFFALSTVFAQTVLSLIRRGVREDAPYGSDEPFFRVFINVTVPNPIILFISYDMIIESALPDSLPAGPLCEPFEGSDKP